MICFIQAVHLNRTSEDKDIMMRNCRQADSARRAVYGVGLKPLNFWDGGFESR